jgi:HEAT repeat protein
VPTSENKDAPGTGDKQPDDLAHADPLLEPPPVPEVAELVLAGIVRRLELTSEVAELPAVLAPLVAYADLAFRTGRFETVVDALGSLISIEYIQLEADSSDDRRREFGQALRKLASPMLLRVLATLRHQHADDPVRAKQLQAILHRYGTDGAEALIDEYASVQSERARAVCLEALKALRRTHDALFDLVRGAGGFAVRQAAELLGKLGDERAEELLVELLRHPDLRTRRAAVAALERFETGASLEALGFALIDEEPLVRLRAVAAIATRRGDAAARLVIPLLGSEPDRDVLHGAAAALGTLATAEAVQALIRVAQGDSTHAHKRSVSYRLQACRALVHVRTPAAMAAVQRLKNDRDREVRSGAMRLVAQASRRSTSSIGVISAP